MNILLFILAAIGLTHIVVDSAVFSPLREWLKNQAPAIEEPVTKFSGRWLAGKIGYLMTCYQCAGVWVGWFLGLIMLTSSEVGLIHNLVTIFVAGMASSFLANWAAIYLTYLESHLK
jgi:Protein of unknown function (DUF1360).